MLSFVMWFAWKIFNFATIYADWHEYKLIVDNITSGV